MTALLTDNLPLLAGAPNGIKKLRELILELAVRGKLVEQDASDEPASELLKRIAAEKMRLVAEGKIKKQKPLPETPLDEAPYGVPVNWAWTRLGEITNFGITTKKDEIPDDAWVLDLEDIEKDTSRLLQKASFFERNSLSDKNSFTKGDVLYGKLRPYLNKVLVAEDDGFCTTEILPFRCYGPFVSRYFMIALKSPYFLSYVNARSYGMKMPRLGTEDGRQAFFPLPPLAEQHRIVAKVDELMALCDRLETQQADAASAHAQLVQALLGSLTQTNDATEFDTNWQRLAEHFHTLFSTEPSIDALKQTLLQLAVMGKLVPQDPSDEPASELLKRIQTEKQRLLVEGKSRKQKELLSENIPLPPYGVPNGWEWEILDSILYITGGVTLGRKLAGRKMVSKPYLRVANVQRGHLALDVMKEVEVPEEEVSKYLLKNGDLLITEGGDWDKVGRTAVWRDELPECLHQNHVFRARAMTDEFESRWAEMYLNSTTARDYFAGSSKQTTNLASINMTQLRACAFPVPPLAEQHRIVAKVDQLMALCDQLKTQLSQARQLNQQLASTLVEQAVA